METAALLGVERGVCVLQGAASNFDTDGFTLLMDWVAAESGGASGESELDLQSYRPWRFGAVHRDPVYASENAREAYRYYYRLRYPLDSDVLGRPKRTSALH